MLIPGRAVGMYRPEKMRAGLFLVIDLFALRYFPGSCFQYGVRAGHTVTEARILLTGFEAGGEENPVVNTTGDSIALFIKRQHPIQAGTGSV